MVNIGIGIAYFRTHEISTDIVYDVLATNDPDLLESEYEQVRMVMISAQFTYFLQSVPLLATKGSQDIATRSDAMRGLHAISKLNSYQPIKRILPILLVSLSSKAAELCNVDPLINRVDLVVYKPYNRFLKLYFQYSPNASDAK